MLCKTAVLPSPRTFQSRTMCEPGCLWMHLGVLVRVVCCVLINVCLSRFIDLGDVSLCDSRVCVPPPLPGLALRACPFQVLRPGNFSTLSWATGNWSSLLPRICLPRVQAACIFSWFPEFCFFHPSVPPLPPAWAEHTPGKGHRLQLHLDPILGRARYSPLSPFSLLQRRHNNPLTRVL